MKTIRELKNEGLISTHLYMSLIRGIGNDDKFKSYNKVGLVKFVDYPDGNDLTVKDIFELWSEKEISRWRGIGQKSLSELKGLI